MGPALPCAGPNGFAHPPAQRLSSPSSTCRSSAPPKSYSRTVDLAGESCRHNIVKALRLQTCRRRLLCIRSLLRAHFRCGRRHCLPSVQGHLFELGSFGAIRVASSVARGAGQACPLEIIQRGPRRTEVKSMRDHLVRVIWALVAACFKRTPS